MSSPTAPAGLCLEDLAVGQSAELTRIASAADVEAFAAVTGDDNPVHLDEAYAASTRFGGRIAHGMLGAGYISAVVGTRLPGPGAVYISQSLAFRRPVRIGDAVTASAEVVAIDPVKARVSLRTLCTVDGKTVIEGEAVVMVPRRAS
ncbi:MAG TPA: MaoC family dehydratase [Caulobacteraceae bacterium]|jgi:3-hydroxybutyryl-CoA dehydratase|nr:MaoC family dehydratase [Caulobacteraceae bacterium]